MSDFKSIENLNFLNRMIDAAEEGDETALKVLKDLIKRIGEHIDDAPVRYVLSICFVVAKLREQELEDEANGN